MTTTAKPITSPPGVALPVRVAELAAKWERDSDGMRAQAVREGLHPALAHGHQEANLLRQRAADLRSLLDEPADTPSDGAATWTVTRLSLIGALRESLDGAALGLEWPGDLADAILAALEAGESR